MKKKTNKQTLMLCVLMSLKKTVGYGPLIEPVIEEKIMKHEPLKRKEKHRPPPPGVL